MYDVKSAKGTMCKSTSTHISDRKDILSCPCIPFNSAIRLCALSNYAFHQSVCTNFK